MKKFNIAARPLNLKLKEPFGLSRGTTKVAKNVLITLDFAGILAYGEAAPSSYYGEDQDSVISFVKSFIKSKPLDDYVTNINLLKEDLNSFTLNIGQNMRSNIFSYSARVALEMAFWDLIGKINEKPLYKFFFPDDPFVLKNGNSFLPQTSYTIAIDDLNSIKRKTLQAVNDGFNILKIKLGMNYDYDLEILELISSLTGGKDITLRVDANGGWDYDTASRMIEKLSKLNVEFIEQPLSKGSNGSLQKLYDNSPIPIFVDEDCMISNDIESLAGKVHGINIKLMKCGSLIEALNMINLAKAYSLKVMLGCMIESSCSISAAAHLSPLVDYVDLDGHLLIEEDPFTGLHLDDNRVVPSLNDGLGVELSCY